MALALSSLLYSLRSGVCLPDGVGTCRLGECQLSGGSCTLSSPAISNSLDFLGGGPFFAKERGAFERQRKTHITNSPSPTLDVCIKYHQFPIQHREVILCFSLPLFLLDNNRRIPACQHQSEHTLSPRLAHQSRSNKKDGQSTKCAGRRRWRRQKQISLALGPG